MNNPTLISYYDTFLDHLHDENNATSTIERHQYYLDQIIFPALGEEPLCELTRETAGRIKRIAREKLLGRTSERRVALSLRRYLKYIQEHHQSLAFDWRDISLPKIGNSDPESFDLEEIKFIFEQLDLSNFYDLRLRLYFELLFRAGLRPSEPLFLNRTTDIDLENEKVRAYDEKKKEHAWIDVKGIRPLLSKYLEYRFDNRPELFVGGTHFMQTDKLDLDGIKSQIRRFRKRLRKAGFERRIYPYMFRKSLCTTLIRSGMDLKSIQLIMRHADPSTTLRHYAAIKKEEANEQKSQFMMTIEFPMINFSKAVA